MDATKLRPSKSHSRAYPGGRPINAVPGHDHDSIWYDCDSKRYLCADEPYERSAERRAAERAAWAEHYGYAIVKPAWPGMYFPEGGSRLYLIADAENGIPLEPIAAALNKLTKPIVEEPWEGESAPTVPILVSPGTTAQAEVERAKPRGPRKPSGQRNSVGYVQTFVGPQRRPKGRMPIECHAEVGRLLNSVLVDTYERRGVYNRVNAVRSELDEWVQREYTASELPQEQFLELYYHGSGSSFPRSLPAVDRDRHVDSLTQARKVLIGHYPECPPLRSLLKKVDAAITSLRSWAP